MSSLPRRFASGTFPVSRNYHLRQMLYSYRDNSVRHLSDRVLPSFPFSDVPVYADTVDIETLAFHDFWGCLLTPDNVAARIDTQDLRYHVWVAAKHVVESKTVRLGDREALLQAVTDQFMIELGLVLLDLCPGPLLLFVDPRLHDDSERMVARAIALVTKFDQAHVRRWRIIVTVPATEQGIEAARQLVDGHGIQTHLSFVSCLEHAVACIDAGAGVISMGVRPIMEWYEQRCGQACLERLSQDHPGIEAIQSCATFIHHRGLNATLLTTDVRKWSELKQLGGIGATALAKDQLDQIPMERLVTWYPRSDDNSPATSRADEATYPPHLENGLGFLASLPAERRSIVSAVLHTQLGKMAVCMDAIDEVVWDEIERRVTLEAIPLELVFRRRPVSGIDAAAERQRRRSKSRSRSTCRRRLRSEKEKESATVETTTMIEGVDYF